MKTAAILTLLIVCCLSKGINAQHHHEVSTSGQKPTIDAQPLLANAMRLSDALNFLGSPLPDADVRSLKALIESPDKVVDGVQKLLDPYCLFKVTINPEARVSVDRGNARPILIHGGWKTFLVRVNNDAGVNSKLKVESPNDAPLFHGSSGDARPSKENLLSRGEVANRFLEIVMYDKRPMQSHLSGQRLEYAVVQIYCREQGKKEASIGFNVGSGTQDIGFRNAVAVLFDIRTSVKVKLNVKDEDGKPAFASFVIQDGIERILPDSTFDPYDVDYRAVLAAREYNVVSKTLKGIYPLPSRRLAVIDKYPDFFFQPQIYRTSGEDVMLPPGKYEVTFTRGPEYLVQKKVLTVPVGKDSLTETFQLKRWVNMGSLGWYSADHHIHAAGCSHYESPEEGVDPEAMIRQIKGEDLNVAAVLTWGPGWYHQKQFFSGVTSKLSTPSNLMHYDVEVSGFPSSHAGHLVLLGLTEDDYPGTKNIEDWPTWTGPVLAWGKKQNGITGYAHSGWGLEPVSPTVSLPNDVVPKMDGIGANEYIVTVTQGLVDVYSAGDTPAPWELNMWYHTLNCGFKVRISGETDFPCIFDERVGLARSYFKNDVNPVYENYLKALKAGRSYVSDGKAHIVDFKVNDMEMGVGNSQLDLSKPGTVNISARATAWLDADVTENARDIKQRPLTESPYWHIERARIGESRRIAVELIFNGQPVDTINIEANGKWTDLKFTYRIEKSGWIALRTLPSVHTNPIFIEVNKAPINVPSSALWCRKALDQCWKKKKEQISAAERPAAEAMYQKAKAIYDKMSSAR